MTIAREHLQKAAKAAGIVIEHDDGTILRINYRDVGIQAWNPLINRGQLHDLAMACKIDISPRHNEIEFSTPYRGYSRIVNVNCQDFPALAEAVILAACEQFDAKGGE